MQLSYQTNTTLLLDRSEQIFASTMSTIPIMPLNQTTTTPPSNVLRDSAPIPMILSEKWGYMSLENVRRVQVGETITLSPFTVPLYGWVMPIFAIITLCTNCLVCLILTQTGMRNATGCLLVAIAISEMSLAIWPVPPFMYFFTLGNYQEWVPHPWCYVSLWMLEFLPTIFHGTCVWLTVALAGQRYLAVCKPLETQKWCVTTAPGAVQCAIVIFIMALGSQISRIFESNFSPIELPSRVNTGETVTACLSEFAPFVNAFTDIYFKVYFCFRTITLNVIPCLLVIYLVIRIVHTKVRSRYPKDPMAILTYRSRLKRYLVHIIEGKYGTGLILGFLALFLLIEIPLTSFYLIELLQYKMVLEFDIIGTEKLTSIIMFANMCTVIVGPIKFVIYCVYCDKFRKRLKLFFLDLKECCSCGLDEEDLEELE